MHNTLPMRNYFVFDSSLPHGLQPTRLLHPWDFPGKSTGVGCHYLLRTVVPFRLKSCSRHIRWTLYLRYSKWKSLSRVWLFMTPRTIYSPWNYPGQNTGVGSHSICQGIFPAQVLNPGLLHCSWFLYQLSHKGIVVKGCWEVYPNFKKALT